MLLLHQKVLGFKSIWRTQNADLKGFKLTCTPNLGRIENDTNSLLETRHVLELSLPLTTDFRTKNRTNKKIRI